jgi:hypothetical protein
MTLTAEPVVRHVYRPRGSAVDVLHAQDDEVLVAGPAGTGKSRACLEKLHFLCLGVPGIKILAIRKTLVSLSATGMQTYQDHVAAKSIAAGHVSFFGGNQTQPAAWRYVKTGAKLVVGGMDNPLKIMSSEYDVIYIQEANEVTLTDWESCISRLRNGVLPYQQIIADCNPDAETHWLYMRWQEKKLRMINSLHTDNPVYFDDEGNPTEKGKAYVLGRLASLSGVRRARLYEGRWVAAEGIIYEHWDPSHHMVDKFEIPDSWPRFWAVDFGLVHPFVCQWWAEDPDGRLFRYREIHMSGRIIEEHARDMLLASTRVVKKGGTPEKDYGAGDEVLKDIKEGYREWAEPKPQVVITDHDAEGRQTLKKHLNMVTKAADKTVLQGIDAVAARLQKQRDGRARLFLVRDALHEVDIVARDNAHPLCTEAEFPAYVWARNAQGEIVKEQPKKEHDDGMDTLRYMVAYKDLRGGAGMRRMP